MLHTVPEAYRDVVKEYSRRCHELFLAPAGDFFHQWIPQFYESNRVAVPFEDLRAEQKFEVEWTITRLEVIRYACATLDFNKAHTDGVALFKGRPIAHGMLVASVFSRIFGTDFPGDGTIYLEQTLKWLRPVYIGATVIGSVRITAIDKERQRIDYETLVHIRNPDPKKANELAITGRALVLVPRS